MQKIKMKTQLQVLETKGFAQCFPFVDHFRKDATANSCVIINTYYLLQRKDNIEDEGVSHFYIKVTKITLPVMQVKIFNKLENAITWAEN